MTEERINYIDTAKGIGIFLVVWGHLLPKCFISQWIYTFHMPLFFVITGMILWMKDRSFSFGQVKKLFRGLMIPYFFFSAVYLVAYEWPVNRESLTGLAYMTYQTICFRGMAPLWFLASLFWGEIAVLFLRNRKRWERFVVFCLLFFLQTFVFTKMPEDISGIISNPLLFFVRTSFCVLFLMMGGCVLQGFQWIINWASKKRREKVLLFVLGVLLLCGTGVVVKIFDLRVNLHLYKISNPVVFFLVGITASFAVILLAKSLERINFIKAWGRNSLAIMVIHYPFTQITTQAMKRSGYSLITTILISLGIAIIFTVISNYAGRLLARYLPFSLGKTRGRKICN